jgi:voltage-gated potassium channel
MIVPAGCAVVLEGTRGSSFFFIVDGAAEVTVAGTRVAEFGPGDFFGEMALLGATARTATVTATSRLKLLVVETPGFAAFMRAAPSAAFMLSRAAVERQGRQRSLAVQGVA